MPRSKDHWPEEVQSPPGAFLDEFGHPFMKKRLLFLGRPVVWRHKDLHATPLVTQQSLANLGLPICCASKGFAVPKWASSDELLAVVKRQLDAAVEKLTPPAPHFYHSAAPAPDDLAVLFPPGYGDNIAWHVVCVGRRPGLYASPTDADDQVRGIPKQSRKKKDSRQEALSYYRSQYDLGECARVSEAPPVSHVPVEMVTGDSPSVQKSL
ncbi:hypothetical protein C8R45DRAFT_1107437 [Mycena sanguinolenta]|nr:hypothetical protein C8R45DRAFT_1107437 [Mycena sanguinolenta]